MTRGHWLVAAVVLAPLAVPPFGAAPTVMQAKNAFFIDAGLVLALWAVRSWWLRAALVWAWLGFVLSGMPGWAFVGVLGLLSFALVYQTAADATATEWRRVRAAVVVAALIQLAWIAVQASGQDPIFVPALGPHGVPVYTHRVLTGWFSNPSDTAAFLGLALPLLLSVHALVALPVALVTLLALHSTAGALAVGITALCWAWRHSARWGVAVTALGALALPFWSVLDGGAGNPIKLFIWRHALFLASLKPWTGWGPNAIEYRVVIQTPATNETWNFLFNEWLQGAVEFGVVGVVLGAMIAGLALARAWRYRRLAPELLAGVLVTLALVTMSNALRIGPCALLMGCYLGRLEGLAQGVRGHGQYSG